MYATGSFWSHMQSTADLISENTDISTSRALDMLNSLRAECPEPTIIANYRNKLIRVLDEYGIRSDDRPYICELLKRIELVPDNIVANITVERLERNLSNAHTRIRELIGENVVLTGERADALEAHDRASRLYTEVNGLLTNANNTAYDMEIKLRKALEIIHSQQEQINSMSELINQLQSDQQSQIRSFVSEMLDELSEG